MRPKNHGMSVLTVVAPAKPNAPMIRPSSPKLADELAAIYNLCFQSSDAEKPHEKHNTETSNYQDLVHRPRSPNPPSRIPTPVTAIKSPPEAPVTYDHGFFSGLNLQGFSVGAIPTTKPKATQTPAPAFRPETFPITPNTSEDEGAYPAHRQFNLAKFSSASTLSPPEYPLTPEAFQDASSPMLPTKRHGPVRFKDAAGNIPNTVCVAIKGGLYGTELVGTIVVPNSELIEPLLNARFYPFTPQVFEQNKLYPNYLATKEDKKLVLEAKLYHQYRLDAASPAGAAGSRLHIFVDLSNITIGFYDRLKLNRGINRRVKAPPFSFENFAHILERNRPATFKTVAGSAYDGNDRSQWPVFMKDAEAAGYEMNILSRVTRMQPMSTKRRGRNGRIPNSGNRGTDYTTSDANSSADDSAFIATYAKQGEQAVDEILHLKMCNSVLDHEPSTIVLATGDAAEAEFSDGFLKHAERALNRGWCVELLTWSKNISQAWRSLQRSQKYGDHFRIIDLDDFAEELFAINLN